MSDQNFLPYKAEFSLLLVDISFCEFNPPFLKPLETLIITCVFILCLLDPKAVIDLVLLPCSKRMNHIGGIHHMLTCLLVIVSGIPGTLSVFFWKPMVFIHNWSQKNGHLQLKLNCLYDWLKCEATCC